MAEQTANDEAEYENLTYRGEDFDHDWLTAQERFEAGLCPLCGAGSHKQTVTGHPSAETQQANSLPTAALRCEACDREYDSGLKTVDLRHYRAD